MDNYGSFVDKYEQYTESGGMEHILGRKPALEALGDVRGGITLDFGCGPAVNGPELRKLGATVFGIDIDWTELDKARQLDPLSTYLHYDGLNLVAALGRQQVNGILASFSICTIEEENLKFLLRDMRRLLKLGKRLVIVEPNLEVALGTRYGDLHYHDQPGVKSGDHVHVTLGVGENAVELYHDIYRTHDDYLRLLTDAGFTVTAIEQPKPSGPDAQQWPEAVKTPPFLVIVAE